MTRSWPLVGRSQVTYRKFLKISPQNSFYSEPLLIRSAHTPDKNFVLKDVFLNFVNFCAFGQGIESRYYRYYKYCEKVRTIQQNCLATPASLQIPNGRLYMRNYAWRTCIFRNVYILILDLFFNYKKFFFSMFFKDLWHLWYIICFFVRMFILIFKQLFHQRIWGVMAVFGEMFKTPPASPTQNCKKNYKEFCSQNSGMWDMWFHFNRKLRNHKV